MADHNKPTVTSLYANFVAELDARLDDLALMLDPAKTTASNIPTGAIRWASASSKWQIWSGTAWGDLAATYAINALTASSAAKWTTARTLALSGDVTGSTTLDGSSNKTITATLSNTGVAAGTYKSVTVDAKGRVTGGTNPTTLAGYGITDAVPSVDVAQVPAASKVVKATAAGPIDLGWLDTSVARELRMLAVGVNPSLDLDFGRQNYRRQNGAKGLETLADPFASFITFARSTTASYIGADGLLKTAAINEPRIEYDPVTGECKGLLIEESRANLLTYSDVFNSAVWASSNSTVSDNVEASPDGTMTASKHSPNAGVTMSIDGSATRIYRNFISTLGIVYTFSIFVKKAGFNKIQFAIIDSVKSKNGNINIDTGIINTVDCTANIEDYGNNWHRISVTFTSTAAGSQQIRMSPQDSTATTGDGTSGLYIWGAQLEVGSFPTSYIKTEASAVTRGADNARVTGANFSSWYRQDEGSVLLDAVVLGVSSGIGSDFLRIDDNSNNNRIILQAYYIGAPRNRWLITNNGNTVNNSTVPLNTGVRYRHTIGMKSLDVSTSLNGIDTKSGISSAIIPNGVTQLYIGQNLSGHISRLTYWPKRLTNTQLQELSK